MVLRKENKIFVVNEVIKGDDAFLLSQGSICVINTEPEEEVTMEDKLTISYLGKKGVVKAIVKPSSIVRVEDEFGKKTCHIGFRV